MSEPSPSVRASSAPDEGSRWRTCRGARVVRAVGALALVPLRELARNAVMHRAYDGTNSPIHLSWFTDRVEIISPGGPYGDVSPVNFGQPGVVDYRNPNLADAMRVSGLVQRYGVGIPIARRALRANNQPEPEFRVDARQVRCVVHVRPDWPGNTTLAA